MRFTNNIWVVDMGSLSSKNHGVKYLLCVIDVFTRYAKFTKGLPLTNKKI